MLPDYQPCGDARWTARHDPDSAGYHHPYIHAVDPRDELIARIRELVKKHEDCRVGCNVWCDLRDLIAQYEKGAKS
jgi:hypothetical protein